MPGALGSQQLATVMQKMSRNKECKRQEILQEMTEQFEVEQMAIPDDRLAEMAQNALSKLCETGGRSITMTVPPRIDDTDMVIAEVIRRFKAYAAQQSKMPTEEEMKKRQKDKGDYLREMGYPPQVITKYQDAIKETWEWLRNQIG